jgi:hypothetical protein
MIFTKHVQSTIKQDYFFIKGTIPDINYQYFIDKINKGAQENNNKNFQTNVSGFMTDWKFFNDDPELLKILYKFIQYIEDNLSIKEKFTLSESWGLKEVFGGYTEEHSHVPMFWSGVIYLSNSNQNLIFPQIQEKITPETGSFVIFSSFLKHKTDKRINTYTEKYGISFNFEYDRCY